MFDRYALPGGKRMREYRLYCLDGVGKFTKVHEIEAESDEEALDFTFEK